jgi:anthranilate/para-aminobenzoate synthase component II
MAIVIIDNFDSFTYNLYQLVQSVTPETVTVYRNSQIAFDELCALETVQSHPLAGTGPSRE